MVSHLVGSETTPQSVCRFESCSCRQEADPQRQDRGPHEPVFVRGVEIFVAEAEVALGIW